MKRTKPDKVLRPGLPQLDVIANHADDVRLLLDGVSEVARICHGEKISSVGSVRPNLAAVNINEASCCGEPVQSSAALLIPCSTLNRPRITILVYELAISPLL